MSSSKHIKIGIFFLKGRYSGVEFLFTDFFSLPFSLPRPSRSDVSINSTRRGGQKVRDRKAISFRSSKIHPRMVAVT